MERLLSGDNVERMLIRVDVHSVSFIRDTVKLRLEASKEVSLINCLVNVIILTS